MKNLFLFAFLFASVLAFSQDRKGLAQDFVKGLFIEKEAEKSYALFDPLIQDQLPLSEFTQVGAQITGQVGAFRKVLDVNNEADTYYFYSEFEKTSLDIQITFNKENKIVGFYFVPHKEFEKPTANK